jgi:hypothetical protein
VVEVIEKDADDAADNKCSKSTCQHSPLESLTVPIDLDDKRRHSVISTVDESTIPIPNTSIPQSSQPVPSSKNKKTEMLDFRKKITYWRQAEQKTPPFRETRQTIIDELLRKRKTESPPCEIGTAKKPDQKKSPDAKTNHDP